MNKSYRIIRYIDNAEDTIGKGSEGRPVEIIAAHRSDYAFAVKVGTDGISLPLC